MHGVAIPAAELSQRYLIHDGDGALRVREADLTGCCHLALHADYPELTTPRGAPWFPLLIGLATVATLLLLRFYFRSFRVNLSGARRNLYLFGILAVLLLLHLGVYSLLMMGVVNDYVLSGGFEILSRKAEAALPGARILFWMMVLLGTAGAWRLALRGFERAELEPGQPCQR